MTAPRPNGSNGGFKFKMPNMGTLFLILGGISALLTLIIIQTVISGANKPQQIAETKTRPIVVAAQELLAGEIITPGTVKTVEWPEDHYPQGVMVFSDVNDVVGRALKKDIYPGEPIYEPALSGSGSQGGLPVVIPKGYRAMTILVTENKGVAGFIRPGDYVDIIGSFEYSIPDSGQRAMSNKLGILLQDKLQVTQTVIQNVKVLAIAQEMIQRPSDAPAAAPAASSAPAEQQATNSTDPNANQTASTEPKAAPEATTPEESTKGKVVSSVTLAVTPEQAEKLAFADSHADLRLSLRPEQDDQENSLLGAVTEDVIPLRRLFEKAMQINQDIGMAGDFTAPAMPTNMPSAGGGGYPAAPKDLPDMDATGPGGGAPAIGSGKSVELIEGSAKTTVNF